MQNLNENKPDRLSEPTDPKAKYLKLLQELSDSVQAGQADTKKLSLWFEAAQNTPKTPEAGTKILSEKEIHDELEKFREIDQQRLAWWLKVAEEHEKKVNKQSS
ncbi:hypothetical protein KBB06_00535 [Candidatus Gracilibacteria bacterium]|nr:hypothetical protein [Candidatus Gracilibacteria bacterium]